MSSYTIGLRSSYSIRVDLLGNEFNKGNTFSLDITLPLKLLTPNFLSTKTYSGNNVNLTQNSLDFSFPMHLEEGHIPNSIKSALTFAKSLEEIKLKDTTLSFNPNLLSLYLGHSDDDEVFMRDVGSIAQSIQKKLYSGGNVGYYQSSNDYSLHFGTEQEIDELQGIPMDKLKFEGEAEPAGSLDDLLLRLQ